MGLPCVAPSEDSVDVKNTAVPWGKVLTENLTVAQIVNKFTAFLRTKSFVTLFTTALDWIQPDFQPDEHSAGTRSYSTIFFLRSAVILSSYLGRDVPNGNVPVGFSTSIS